MLHDFRINLVSDTFLNHATNILIRNHAQQQKISNQMADIRMAPNAQLAKLQDDFLKLGEISRLLAASLEVNETSKLFVLIKMKFRRLLIVICDLVRKFRQTTSILV